MSTEQWIALLAVVVAVLALAATALLAVALRGVRAEVRRLVDTPSAAGDAGTSAAAVDPRTTTADDKANVVTSVDATPRHTSTTEIEVATTVPLGEPHGPDADRHIVTRDGRVVVVPSTRQVVEATMGKPMIRGAVLSHGLRYALRAESRDRLRGIIRREYRRRRKIRLRAGRRAARSTTIPPREVPSWLGAPADSRLNADHDGGS